jgi:hypothetical protein
MYQLIETANGWILQPQRFDHGYFEYSKTYVFNDIKSLNEHLAKTLTFSQENQSAKG